LIKINLCFFKILVIDIKEIREYQPLFVEFDEYTRFLYIMTMLRVFYISIIFLVFLIARMIYTWQENKSNKIDQNNYVFIYLDATFYHLFKRSFYIAYIFRLHLQI